MPYWKHGRMVTTVSSRDAVIAYIGRSNFSITAVRRSSPFLTSAGPPDFRKRDPRYFVQTTIFIAIVMVVTDSGIASAGAGHVARSSLGYLMVLTIESTGA